MSSSTYNLGFSNAESLERYNKAFGTNYTSLPFGSYSNSNDNTEPPSKKINSGSELDDLKKSLAIEKTKIQALTKLNESLDVELKNAKAHQPDFTMVDKIKTALDFIDNNVNLLKDLKTREKLSSEIKGLENYKDWNEQTKHLLNEIQQAAKEAKTCLRILEDQF